MSKVQKIMLAPSIDKTLSSKFLRLSYKFIIAVLYSNNKTTFAKSILKFTILFVSLVM